MKVKKEKQNEEFELLVQSVKDKIKQHTDYKYDWINIVYLILPALIIATIVSLLSLSYLFSILLLYFVLPMLYAVDKRLRASLTSIGNRNGSYKKGYDDFFGGKLGGVYGMILGIAQFILFFLFFYFVFSYSFKPLCNMSEESKLAYEMINKAASDSNLDVLEVINNQISYLYKPLMIFLSVAVFLPITYFIMYHVNHNLNKHHMMSIIMPDADKNLPASYQESICEATFCRFYRKDEFLLSLRFNWMYYLLHTLMYGLFTYIFTLFKPSNAYITGITLMSFFSLIVFFDILIDYFTIKNNYLIIEAISERLDKKIPKVLKKQYAMTFASPNYIHGEESSVRGPFFKEDEVYDGSIFDADYVVKEGKNTEKSEKVEGNVIDLSSFKNDDKD